MTSENDYSLLYFMYILGFLIELMFISMNLNLVVIICLSCMVLSFLIASTFSFFKHIEDL